MIQVTILDDHILTLKGTEQVLSENDRIKVTGCFTNGHKLLEFLVQNPGCTDILVLDLNMPDMNGVEVCKKVTSTYPEVRIIILSMIDEVGMVKRMLDYGAYGYLLKNSIQDELINAVLIVYEGKKYFNQAIDHLLSNNRNDPGFAKRKTMRPVLSRREKEVLELIIKEYRTPEIAEKLFISEGTVITHRRHILQKLGVKNTAGIVRVAMEWSLTNV